MMLPENGQTVVPTGRPWTSVKEVCVYDRNAFRRLFILFDVRNGESWPSKL